MTVRRARDVGEGSAFVDALDDRRLTIAFKEGDASAYDIIFERYSPRVKGVCRRMLGHRDDAAEATQETFLRVYKALPNFNGRYQLGAWITRIAANVCLDHLRSRARRPVDMTTADELEEAFDPALLDADPEAIVIRNAESRKVRRVLASLPPLHRAAIVLRDFEGLSYQEVAVALGITDCQVKALIHRARQGFKRSWTSAVASLLIPSRFLTRIRNFDGTARDQASQLLVQSGQVAAPACNSVLQQCGIYLAERAAGVMTAMVVGTAVAATGGAAVVGSDPGPTTAVAEEVAVSLTPKSGESGERSRTKDGNQEAPQQAPVVPAPFPSASPSPSPSTEGTSPSPSPSAEPTPEPGGGGPDPKPTPTPQPSPSPTPFSPYVGTSTSTSFAVAATQHSWQLDCVANRLDQVFSTRFWHDGVGYPARVRLEVSGGWGTLSLAVSHGGRNFNYSLWGEAPQVSWNADGSRLALAARYGPAYDSDPEPVGLPGAGTVAIQADLDCSSNSVVSQQIVFTP